MFDTTPSSRPHENAAVALRADEFMAWANRSPFMQSSNWLNTFCDERESVEHIIIDDPAGSVTACSGLRRVVPSLASPRQLAPFAKLVPCDAGGSRSGSPLLVRSASVHC